MNQINQFSAFEESSDQSTVSAVPAEVPPCEHEILIGRMIDGEATAADHERFNSLAQRDPRLWRTLAMQQQDMLKLFVAVDRELLATEEVGLPGVGNSLSAVAREPIADRRPPESHRLNNLLRVAAYSGWAAVVVLGVFWWVSTWPGQGNGYASPRALPRAIPSMMGQGRGGPMSPEEHLREYLRSPFVLNELPPTLLGAEELSDGRQALRIVRRIEEVAFISADATLPIDDAGDLTESPEKLRQEGEKLVRPD
jgi:hypothetical protein